MAHRSLCHLGLKPYSQVVFKWGLKVRRVMDDRKENKVLNRAMEYAGVVGVELADMLVFVNSEVKVIMPHMPMQHTFGGDSLQNFIHC